MVPLSALDLLSDKTIETLGTSSETNMQLIGCTITTKKKFKCLYKIVITPYCRLTFKINFYNSFFYKLNLKLAKESYMKVINR